MCACVCLVSTVQPLFFCAEGLSLNPKPKTLNWHQFQPSNIVESPDLQGEGLGCSFRIFGLRYTFVG